MAASDMNQIFFHVAAGKLPFEGRKKVRLWPLVLYWQERRSNREHGYLRDQWPR